MVFGPRRNSSWNQSHAQVPTPVLVDSEIIRIYYASRDSKGISRISYVDVSAEDPKSILYEHDSPILDIGRAGTFDDCGVMPSWAIRNGHEVLLYYIGWNVRNTVPYYNSVGLAISMDNGKSFTRFSEGPLWDRDYKEPYFSASTCVIRHDGKWKCWYLSCTEYLKVGDKYEPRYHLKYAESKDGINWDKRGIVAIDYKDSNEGGIVKASVMVESGFYKMWFSYRSLYGFRTERDRGYRIGYAESANGIEWTRRDESAGIELSIDGWDSQMMAYPHVISVGERLYMFYNGNSFGRDGFGYAAWEP